MTTYMICNLIGLSSTCTNPILYGYLNRNIQEVILKRVSDVTDRFCECFDVIKVSYNDILEIVQRKRLNLPLNLTQRGKFLTKPLPRSLKLTTRTLRDFKKLLLSSSIVKP